MEENNLQETQLEHDPILKENISWDQAVQKIESVINDVCREYEKDGLSNYSFYNSNDFQIITKPYVYEDLENGKLVKKSI